MNFKLVIAVQINLGYLKIPIRAEKRIHYIFQVDFQVLQVYFSFCLNKREFPFTLWKKQNF